MTEPRVDLSDPATFVAGVPHDYFAWCREHDPVRWHPECAAGSPYGEAGPGFWAVTRYDDLLTVSRDPETFSSREGSSLIFDLPPEDLEGMRLQLIHMDPPEHTRLRKIVATGFTPRQVNRLGEHVEELTTEIIDRVAPKGECDFVTEIAAELPLLVIAELLGVPAEDRHLLFDWSNRVIGLEDPEYRAPGTDAVVSSKLALLEMFQYAFDLAQEKRAQPTDDIVSALLHAEVEGERLSDPEFNMFFFLLVIAGNETTRNAIAGGFRALQEHPEQLDRLRGDLEGALPTAVEEVLRWVSPVMEFRRTVTRPAELGGTRVEEGDKVVLYYPSANRDEEHFDEPQIFDVTRDPNPHLAFGFGTHFCLGSSLARLEIRTMFRELFTRLGDIEIAGPVERLQSNFINGIKHMPVRFTPERA